MHDSEIQEIISACRSFAAIQDVVLPPIDIDRSKIARTLSENAVAVLTNASSNMAAKVIAHANQMDTPHWEAGRVICISDAIVNASADSMQAIGVIVHEMGHAFNIAARKPNTEANAQVFEIEMLLHYLDKDKDNDVMAPEALDAFFTRRIPRYLANDPASSGYVHLHAAIRKLPAFYCTTHETYNKGVEGHFSTHKRRGSLKFFEVMEELDLIPIRERRSGSTVGSSSNFDPTKIYPLIKWTDKPSLFFRAKKLRTATFLSGESYSY